MYRSGIQSTGAEMRKYFTVRNRQHRVNSVYAKAQISQQLLTPPSSFFFFTAIRKKGYGKAPYSYQLAEGLLEHPEVATVGLQSRA